MLVVCSVLWSILAAWWRAFRGKRLIAGIHLWDGWIYKAIDRCYTIAIAVTFMERLIAVTFMERLIAILNRCYIYRAIDRCYIYGAIDRCYIIMRTYFSLCKQLDRSRQPRRAYS